MTSVISKLADIDPVFRDVVDTLYPDMDPRELWDLSKAMPDQADVHAQKRQKTQARVALASNAVGLTAGTAGLSTAMRDDRLKDGGKVARSIYRAGTGIKAGAEKTKIGAKYYKMVAKPKVAAGLAAGAVGLQVANLAGDAVANRVLARSAKSNTNKPQTHFAKADVQGALEDIIAARRAGQIDTETAINMADDLAKRFMGPNKLAAMHVGLKDAIGTHARPIILSEAGKGRLVLGGAGAVGGFAVGRSKQKKANRAKLADAPNVVTKSVRSEEVDYGFVGEISKMDLDKRQVFGWCSLSTVDGQPVVDLQNDYIPIDEIEKSAYAYVVDSRKGGDMHKRNGEEPLHTSDMIESFVVTPEKLKQMGFDDAAIAKSHVGWWVGFKVNDDSQWDLVKKGERSGFSVHGKGNRISKELS